MQRGYPKRRAQKKSAIRKIPPGREGGEQFGELPGFVTGMDEGKSCDAEVNRR